VNYSVTVAEMTGEIVDVCKMEVGSIGINVTTGGVWLMTFRGPLLLSAPDLAPNGQWARVRLLRPGERVILEGK
jgi:hypothetical protein